MSTETADPQTWTLAARIVFPPSGEEDTLPLYVDFGRATPIEEKPNGKVASPAEAGLFGKLRDAFKVR